ncbi:MAG TPA: ABC transporter substrate-binding protein [Acetobacteraceae bacterium]|nr:ABC transporter substrate-binding protein [Acetobacteraceae bacterium]
MLRNHSERRSRCYTASTLPRRRLLGLGLCAVLPVARAKAEDPASWAKAFIRRVGNEIAATVASPEPSEMRKHRLTKLINDVVDIPAAARFCLGRFWRQATAQQQQTYVALFHAVLLRAVLGRIDTEQQIDTGQQKDAGIQVSVGRPEMRKDGVYVPTVIQRPNMPAFNVTWVVNTDAANPRIVDVIAEGTSLRITIRADYASFLNHHDDSIDALLQALRQQACDNCSNAANAGGQ